MVKIYLVWKLCAFFLLFLTGILVIVFYFTSISKVVYFHMFKFGLILPCLVLFFPYVCAYLSGDWYYIMFGVDFYVLIVILFLALGLIIVFSRYLLGANGALRNI